MHNTNIQTLNMIYIINLNYSLNDTASEINTVKNRIMKQSKSNCLSQRVSNMTQQMILYLS